MTQELLWKKIRKFQSDIARLHQVFVESFCADAELEPGTEQVIRARLEGGYEQNSGALESWRGQKNYVELLR